MRYFGSPPGNATVIDPDGDVILVVTPKAAPSSKMETEADGEVKAEGEGEEEAKEEPQAKAEPEAVRFQASSKHLTLGSKYFKGRFSEPWPEAEALRANKMIEVDVPDTDPKAFEIALNLMHSRTTSVPRKIELPLLTEIAVVVDYLNCHESLGLFPESWIDGLRKGVPTKFCEDTVKWICVSSVFRDAEIFSSTTLLAQRQSVNIIDNQHLPISQAILDKMNNTRVTALEGIFRAITGYVDRLAGSGPSCVCSTDCDALKLGTILREMKISGLENICVDRPFPGCSIEGLVAQISKFRRLTMCGRCRALVNSSYPSSAVYSPIDSKTNSEIRDHADSPKALELPILPTS